METKPEGKQNYKVLKGAQNSCSILVPLCLKLALFIALHSHSSSSWILAFLSHKHVGNSGVRVGKSAEEAQQWLTSCVLAENVFTRMVHATWCIALEHSIVRILSEKATRQLSCSATSSMYPMRILARWCPSLLHPWNGNLMYIYTLLLSSADGQISRWLKLKH